MYGKVKATLHSYTVLKSIALPLLLNLTINIHGNYYAASYVVMVTVTLLVM